MQFDTEHLLAGKRVLIVDDNEINREVAFELLDLAGVLVAFAEDGLGALSRLHEAKFDLVLMDCQMPIMDGFEATRAIRANAAWAGLPVVAFTSNVLGEDRDRIFAAGMVDVIAKPIEVAQFFKTLQLWLCAR